MKKFLSSISISMVHPSTSHFTRIPPLSMSPALVISFHSFPSFRPMPNCWNPVKGFGNSICSLSSPATKWLLVLENAKNPIQYLIDIVRSHYDRARITCTGKACCLHVTDHAPWVCVPFISVYSCLFSCTGNVSLVYVRIAFTMLAKCSISGAFIIVFLYTPEIFPTTLRSRWLALL